MTRLSAFGLLAFAVGCDDAPPPTLRFVIETDLAVPDELDELAIRLAASRTDEGDICTPTARGFRLGASDDLPVRVAVERGGRYTSWAWIRVEGFAAGRLVVAREVLRAWPAEGSLDVDVPLERACRDVPCGPGDQCIAGVCRPLQVPGLPDDPARIDATRCDTSTP